MTLSNEIQRINTNEVMSAVTIHRGVVYLSGQVPSNTDSDIQGQTQNVLAKIDELLGLAQTDKSRILSAQLFVKNISDFKMVNAIWIEWLQGHATPARATIQTNLVNPDWLIEISVIAAQP